MDKQTRFKLKLPRFFKSSIASCRTRLLSDTTTTTTTTTLPNSQPIIPPSSIISSTSFNSISKPTHHPLFYNPQFTFTSSSSSPISSLILDREFYHNPSKKQSKIKNKNYNKKKKLSKNKRKFLTSDDGYDYDMSNEDVFFSCDSSSTDSFNTRKGSNNVVAVVKSSDDVYEDFRTSMVEMIVEKQILNVKDLEMLLKCFLELNSRRHHRVILNVFVEILETLFGRRD